MPLRHVAPSFLRARIFVAASGLALSTLLAGCGSGVRGALAPAAPPTSAPVSAIQDGPQLGYIWSDKTRTLRPVLGIPGSSQLGQSVVPANLYLGAASSAVSSLALLQENDGSVDLMALPTGTPARLPATLAPGAQIRFAPSGLSAVAFVPGAKTATLFTSLAGSPQARQIALNAPISEAAASDAGSIAAALGQATGFTVRTVSASGLGNVAGTVSALGGLSFVGSSDDLLMADASSNTLTLVRGSTTSPIAAVLRSADLLKAPLGVAASHDAHWAVLANGGDASIVRIDLTAATAPQRFSCLCQPTLVAQLSGTGVFRVTGADSGPAWMLDAAGITPRVLFIPASADAPTSSIETAGQK